MAERRVSITLQIWAPKVVHGVVAAMTDVALVRLARRLAGERYVDVAVGATSSARLAMCCCTC